MSVHLSYIGLRQFAIIRGNPRLNNITIYLISIVIYITYYLTISAPVFAQNSPLSLTVSPAIKILDLQPGEEKKLIFQITNLSSQKITLRLDYRSFRVQDRDGQVELTAADKNLRDTIKYGNLLLPQEVLLSPGELRTIPFLIHLPDSVKKKDYNLAVLFTAKSQPPPQKTLTVNNHLQIVSLVFLRVGRDPVKDIGNISFNHFDVDFPLVIKTPVIFNARIMNQNQFSEMVKGRIEITNLLGRTTASVNIPGQIVAGKAEKHLRGEGFALSWQPQVTFGLYRARINLQSNGKTASANSRTFLILPSKAIVILFLGILAIIGIKRAHKKSGQPPASSL